jgi:hypothetical protein
VVASISATRRVRTPGPFADHRSVLLTQCMKGFSESFIASDIARHQYLCKSDLGLMAW